MNDAIIIATSDGFEGYGDFLFSLKIASQIQEIYKNIDKAPIVYIVTQASGRHRIQSIKGDEEFNIIVITPEELEEKVNQKEMFVLSVIEGPIFKSEFISEVDQALVSQGSRIPLIMIYEYGFDVLMQDEIISEHNEYRTKELKHLIYQKTIYTGFNKSFDQHGIILTPGLINQDSDKDNLIEKLDQSLRENIFKNLNFSGYNLNNELFIQYSHDIYTKESPARRFLEIHRRFIRDSNKNQDIIMVGNNKKAKQDALSKVKNYLIQDGFNKIIFLNAMTNEETILHEDSNQLVRSYRVIYMSSMTHVSMISCMALSEDLVGVTGDQSFGEAISANKVITSECRNHKVQLLRSYYNILTKQYPELSSILELLLGFNSRSILPLSTKQYDEVKNILTKEFVEKIKSGNEALRKNNTLRDLLVHLVSPLHLTQEILNKDKINPYYLGGSISFFERAFMLKDYDLIIDTIKKYSDEEKDQSGLCQILTKKNNNRDYLSILREAKPNLDETKKASYLVVKYKLKQYVPKGNYNRKQIVDSLLSMVKNFDVYKNNEATLIEKSQRAIQDISNEYSIFSPEKGVIFGSELYSILVSILTSLSIQLKQSPEQPIFNAGLMSKSVEDGKKRVIETSLDTI
ncbi:hypothetical protein L3V86_01340 [Thiotrichales bacterium 19S11-10]|nr:hypothetical protein [Thiotrichales bacterium 19S11-10]